MKTSVSYLVDLLTIWWTAPSTLFVILENQTTSDKHEGVFWKKKKINFAYRFHEKYWTLISNTVDNTTRPTYVISGIIYNKLGRTCDKHEIVVMNQRFVWKNREIFLFSSWRTLSCLLIRWCLTNIWSRRYGSLRLISLWDI